MDIIKMLNEANEKRIKKISDNSIKTYNSNLKILNKLITNADTIKNIDFVRDVDKIMETLKDKSTSTKRNYITAIVVLLKLMNEPELLEKYTALMMDLNEKVSDNYDKNEKTKKQEDNWVEYKEILKLLKKYKNDTSHLFEKEELTSKEQDLIQQYLILYLYSGKAFPIIRNDFADMQVVNNEDNLDSNKNYLVIPTKRKMPYFHLGEFKTKKSKSNNNEPYIIKLEDRELKKLIHKWLKITKNDYLLINLSGNQKTPKGSPMTANGITKYLQKIFLKHLGKSISTSLLRSIYISHKYKQNLNTKEKKELAVDMLHSKPMAEEVYNKIV